jgi:hypothetical protein
MTIDHYKLRNNTSVLETLVQNKLAPVHALQVYGGVEVQFHSFVTSALYGGKRVASR